MEQPILEVKNLKKHYPIYKGLFRKKVATRYVVDGVDISIQPGQTVALVGESGCGKTVLLRVLMGLEDQTDGSIAYKGKDIASFNKAEKKRMHSKIQMIFQDSMSSLHPRFTIMESLAEPLLLNKTVSKQDVEEHVIKILEKVGLDADYRFRYPGSLSGGQRQRVVIARALVERPDLILADEPISALDVSLQAQVLNLLMDLQDEFHLSMLFVAHDLAVVRQISDYILIMYAGQILESAPSAAIYSNACHPYTQVLLESAPSISKGIVDEPFQVNLKVGDTPDPVHLPSGCIFHTRCVYADQRCSEEVPEKYCVGDNHYVCCHRMQEAAVHSEIER